MLTLRVAVLTALADNERMLASRESIQQARLAQTLAASTLGTRISPNLLGSFGQSDVRNQTYGVGASKRFLTGTEVRMDVGASTFRNQIGNFYAADTTLLVSQSLLRGLGPIAGRRPMERSAYQLATAERRHALAEEQLAIEVAGLYYRLIAQRESVIASRTALENAQRLLDASEAKLRANLVSQLDVFRARQLVAAAGDQLFDVEGAVADLKDQMRFLLSRDTDYDFRVAAEIDVAGVQPMAMEIAVATAMDNRIELRDADAAVEEARARMYATRAISCCRSSTSAWR